MKAGRNSIYLNGAATYLTPDQHIAGSPDVEEVWRWNPNPAQIQFTASPGEPTPGTPEWSVWRRGQPEHSDLTLLKGQTSSLPSPSAAITTRLHRVVRNAPGAEN